MSEGRDPSGKRALFETPAAHSDDRLEGDPLVGGEPAEGLDALYSTGPHRPGTVVLACAECGVHSRMTRVEALVRIAAISAWIPGKRYSRWMLCPECQRRTWCRVQWLA